MEEREDQAPITTHERTDAIRVGYVNISGLTKNDWEEWHRWIEHGGFDLLFIAETWYVGWPNYTYSQSTVAATPRPAACRGSRYSGGLCVLATPALASRVTGVPMVSEMAITVQFGEYRVSGVYFPPSMPYGDMALTLSALETSTLVLGDFNTRFGRYSGEGTPRDRVELISQWAQTARLVHLSPQRQSCPIRNGVLHPESTVDHAFIKGSVPNRLLWLLDTSSMRLSTDHRYTLCVLCPLSAPRPSNSTAVRRFWIHRLCRVEVVDFLIHCWERTSILWHQSKPMSINQRHQMLVERCQKVCKRVLGQVPEQQSSKLSSPKHSDEADGWDDFTPTRTYYLMKQAIAADRDNKPLLPSEPGGNALGEAAEMFRLRYTQDAGTGVELEGADEPEPFPTPLSPFTREAIRAEIHEQYAAKACGADGIHIRVLKALVDTSLVDMLLELYCACWNEATTPTAWNLADICLVIKDGQQPKTPANVRPITLICLFRKLFEAILLRAFDAASDTWARIHPTQAGFRHTHSTLTQAAALDAMFRGGLIDTIVFLDFQAAFDVLDHDRLFQILRRRRCPKVILALILGLVSNNLYSRILANDCASDWFLRSRGILQGSPLSPILFNLFVDDLLHRLNRNAGAIPRALFYADDGALLGNATTDIQQLLDLVIAWSDQNGIRLNIKKCGHMTTQSNPSSLYAGPELIPATQHYRYLGFPVSVTQHNGQYTGGIDWSEHLRSRIGAAKRRAEFLKLFLASAGQAHRLRVYHQWLAPMFEYGAALVYTWLISEPGARETWAAATVEWKDLICWISGSGKSWRVAANLLGLTALEERFMLLHAAFQWQLDSAGSESVLDSLARQYAGGNLFLSALRQSPMYLAWRWNPSPQSFTKASLTAYLDRQKRQLLHQTSQSKHLTAIVPFGTRQSRSLRYADVVLTAPLEIQRLLFQYRLGAFANGYRHKCPLRDKPFRRGDEECPCFGSKARLSRRRRKEQLRIQRGLRGERRFTVVDYWLSVKKLDRAGAIVQQAYRTLRMQYSAACFDEGGV